MDEEKKKEYTPLSQQELKVEMLNMIRHNSEAQLRNKLQQMSHDELKTRALAVAQLLAERGA